MKKLKTETKLWIESTIPDYKRVNIKKNADNGYDWFKYFLADIDNETLDKFISEDYSDLYDFLEAKQLTIIQLLIGKIFKDNNIRLSDIEGIDLFINDEYGADFTDPGYDESYSLFESYLICHSNNKVDYVISIDSDFYEGYAEYERAELEATI